MVDLVVTAFDGALPDVLITIAQVSVGYVLLCLAIPCLCMHSLLAKRSLGVRLMTYQIAGLLYITAVGFILAFVNAYNPATVWLAHVVLPLLYAAAFPHRSGFLSVFHGFFSSRSDTGRGVRTLRFMMTRAWQGIQKRLSGLYKQYIKNHVLTFIAWIVLGLFLLCFFGYFRLHYLNYSCSDDSTHLYWVRALMAGDPFPAGLYPHAEHFLAASICCLFGITPARCWLIINVLTNFLVFWGGYLFLRETFCSRTAAVGSLAICLTTNLLSVATYTRFVFSVPMEFAFFATFASFLGLALYLKHKERFYLVLFCMGLSLTFQIHFYVTIFTIVLIFACAIVFCISALRKKIFHKIFLASLLTLILSLAPFVIGYAIGIPFEQSISWALGVTGIDFDQETMSVSVADSDETSQTSAEPSEKATAIQEGFAGASNPLDFLRAAARVLSVSDIAQTDTAAMILALILLFNILYGLCGVVWCTVRKKKDAIWKHQMNLALTLSWLFGLVLLVAPFFNYPALISTGRTVVFLGIWLLPVAAIPLQAFIDFLKIIPIYNKQIENFTCFIIILLTCVNLETNAYARDVNNLQYSFVTQEADIATCIDLVETREPQTWTLISPVSDLSAIRYSGYHYEVTDLLLALNRGEKEIYIPTPDIFVYVETKIPDMFEGHFVTGSDFDEKVYPILPEAASEGFEEYLLNPNQTTNYYYSYYMYRTPLMSRLYYWIKKIESVYPNEVSIYYQDDYVTIYHIKQDPYFLLNLSVDFDDLIEADLHASSAS